MKLHTRNEPHAPDEGEIRVPAPREHYHDMRRRT
jgi:hypothetical protein